MQNTQDESAEPTHEHDVVDGSLESTYDQDVIDGESTRSRIQKISNVKVCILVIYYKHISPNWFLVQFTVVFLQT